MVQKQVQQGFPLILGDCRCKMSIANERIQTLDEELLTIVAIPLCKHEHALVEYHRQRLGRSVSLPGSSRISEEMEDESIHALPCCRGAELASESFCAVRRLAGNIRRAYRFSNRTLSM